MSTITLINETDEVVRLAIFKQPVANPNLATIAWRIAEPPPGGQQTIALPNDFSIFAQYSNSADPADLSVRTNIVPFSETTAGFTIDSLTSQDRRASGAQISQQFVDLVLNEVRVYNNYGRGCLTTIAKDGDAIYAPQVIWPGGLFLEDVRSSFYVSVTAQFTVKGQRLVQEEFQQTQTEVLEGGTIVVRGSQWKGYSLSAT